MKRDLDGQLENYRVTREMADEIRPLLDENRKYRKAIEAMKWRPIDTAPLDGAEVDLWIRAEGSEFRAPSFKYDGNKWVGKTSGEPIDWHYGNVGMRITHWMPTPAPPAPDESEAV